MRLCSLRLSFGQPIADFAAEAFLASRIVFSALNNIVEFLNGGTPGIADILTNA